MPKIYKNPEGHITIIYVSNEPMPGVTLVKDRGAIVSTPFGTVPRFAYHWGNVFNNTSHTTNTNTSPLSANDKRYKLIRSKQK